MPTATCHCGDTRITVPHVPQTATACTCTFCTKKAVLWGYYQPAEIVIQAGDKDRLYAPSGVNHHHFCGICGCATWSVTPDWEAMSDTDQEPPTCISVNLCLLDDVDTRSLPAELLDGLTAW